MGFERGFLEYERIEPETTPVKERVKNFKEYFKTLTDDQVRIQAGRCMDCGTPYCMYECPLHNTIPDVNDFACKGQFQKALNVLSSTNPFPDFTGRLCPALCEEGCTLGLHRQSVGIKSIERKICEYAFDHGLVHAELTLNRSFKKVAIVGSGPAALACAQGLARRGHNVTVYEKNDKPGGLLRYGIPDFKLPKEILDRRLSVLEGEGIAFKTGVRVGKADPGEKGVFCNASDEIPGSELLSRYDAVVLCPGSEVPRDLKIAGRDLKGVHFALEFLIAQNLEIQGRGENPIDVAGKKVVVIGGGETASDCIGTAIRKGASSVTQLDYHDELPESVDPMTSWPQAHLPLAGGGLYEAVLDEHHLVRRQGRPSHRHHDPEGQVGSGPPLRRDPGHRGRARRRRGAHRDGLLPPLVGPGPRVLARHRRARQHQGRVRGR